MWTSPSCTRSAVNFYLAGQVEFQPYLLARGDGSNEVCLG